MISTIALPLPIPEDGRRIARQFATEQPTPDKAGQVFLNTLSVWIVNSYLQMLNISTNLLSSDSWNPIMRLCADVADLEVTGVGKLECRPVKAFQTVCPIPAEVWHDRIGYVVVEIDDSLRKARLLGYTPTATTEELPLTQLQPLEDLLDSLDRLTTIISKVNLSQWFEQIFTSGWEVVETLLDPAQVNFAFRGTVNELESLEAKTLVRRGQLIEVKQNLVLIVELEEELEQRTSINLQVHPFGEQIYLPADLKLSVIDDSSTVFMETRARSVDNYIQLQFSGQQGENFSVRVTLGDASISRDFVI